MVNEDQIPVPTVRLILPDELGRVLLLQRPEGNRYGAGGWCLPGGKVDYGATVAQTIQDELMEETGLICGGYSFLTYQDGLPEKPGEMHCINLYFECAWQGEIRLNRESQDYRWVGPVEVGNYRIVFSNEAGIREYWWR